MKLDSWVFASINQRFGRFWLWPKGWRRIAAGESRLYVTALRPIDCQAALQSGFATDEITLMPPPRSTLVGTVADGRFRMVINGGISSSTGIPLTLFGTIRTTSA